MCSSSTFKPSHTPERTAAAAAEEELIAAVGVLLLDDGGRRKREQDEAGERERKARKLCRSVSPRLLIALRAEKPRGRAWD